MTDPHAPDPQAPDWEAFYASYRKPGYIPGYEITSKLGGGAFGIVFRARKQSIGKDYAIKFLKLDADLDVRRGVLQELDSVRLFAQVDHPNLVAIEDQGVVDGIPYLVMGFAGSETLRDRLPARDAGDRDELRRLFLQACRGVSALHDRSLVHFDLKPANVFLKGGVARVGDYGLSRMLSHSRATLSMGRGTPYYMAPELLRRHGDWRSDIYALGVMLYEILLGRLPFQGDSEWEVLKKHETEAPDLPASLATRDRDVLARALAKEPAERFQTVAELMNALLGTSGELPPFVGRVPPGSAKPSPDPALAEAKRKLQTAARDVGSAAATFARHAARRARESAEKAVLSARQEAREAGVAPVESERAAVGPGPHGLLLAHLEARRLRRRARRARRMSERALRRTERRSRRRFPLLGAAGFLLFTLAAALMVGSGPVRFVDVSESPVVSSPVRIKPWPSPETSSVLRRLPQELRALVSLSEPDWRRSFPDRARATRALTKRLELFRSSLGSMEKVLLQRPSPIPNFGPVRYESTYDDRQIVEAIERIASDDDGDGSARVILETAGRDALDLIAYQLEIGGGSATLEPELLRFERLNRLLGDLTGFHDIRFEAENPMDDSTRAKNAAAGPIWRWFLREFAYDQATWRGYRGLVSTAPGESTADGR